jgi:hypothetical protein
MKPKYLFYLLIIIVMHYEVGRLISVSQPQEEPENQSFREKAVKIYPQSDTFKPIFMYRAAAVRPDAVKKHYKYRHAKFRASAE